MTITRLNPEYTPKNYWDGFTHLDTDTWGVQTGTLVTRFDAANGSSMVFRRDCPSAGKLSLVLDGTVYVEEGNNRVLDARDMNNMLAYKGFAKNVSTNFNNITASGIYYLDATSMSNGPSNYVWSYLVVLGFGLITQIIVKPVSSVLVMREYSGSPSSWKAWVSK